MAVYIESANINSDEWSKIVDAIGVVESRFENQLGYKVDLEIVGSWTSRKNTDNYVILLNEAISKTNGVVSNEYDNYPSPELKFHRNGYTAAVYIIDQPLDGGYVGGAAKASKRACIADYSYCKKYWRPFDGLCSIIQHELSHLFGLQFECQSEWCIMNYKYMPYEEYAGWWIIRWKTKEEWASTWCQNCREKLLQTYNGAAFRYSETYVTFWGYYEAISIVSITWTEEYHHWNLTHCRLKSIYTFGMPIIWYVPRGAAHPSFSYPTQASHIVVEP